MKFIIKQEVEANYQYTEEVIRKAFEKAEITDHKEHLLVAKLRTTDAFIPELSLVAVHSETDQIIGHILLTKIHIVNGDQKQPSLALAPVSVLPKFQQQGIGKALIEEAIQVANEAGHESIIVLGHPSYYPKFGFKKASNWHIQAPFEVPDDAFMALELKEHALTDVNGTVLYSKAFLE